MAISVVKIGRQRSLSSLAKSVFDLEGASAATVRSAAQLLLSANPHLADEASIKAGLTVIVPDGPQLAGGKSESETIPVGKEGLGELAIARVERLSGAITKAAKSVDTESGRERDWLGDEQLIRAFIAAQPEVEGELAGIRKTSAARAAAAEEEAAALRKAVQRMRKAIESDRIASRFAGVGDK